MPHYYYLIYTETRPDKTYYTLGRKTCCDVRQCYHYNHTTLFLNPETQEFQYWNSHFWTHKINFLMEIKDELEREQL